MNEAGHTSVIIIDDHPLFRKGVADLIGMEPALRLVGEAADGYLLKDMEPEDILQSLQRATRGRLVISQQLTELLARALREKPHPQGSDEAALTPREEEILRLIAKGYSNKLIARELDLSVGTVKVHVKHILKKLKLKTRVEAAVWAVKGRR